MKELNNFIDLVRVKIRTAKGVQFIEVSSYQR